MGDDSLGLDGLHLLFLNFGGKDADLLRLLRLDLLLALLLVRDFLLKALNEGTHHVVATRFVLQLQVDLVQLSIERGDRLVTGLQSPLLLHKLILELLHGLSGLPMGSFVALLLSLDLSLLLFKEGRGLVKLVGELLDVLSRLRLDLLLPLAFLVEFGFE